MHTKGSKIRNSRECSLKQEDSGDNYYITLYHKKSLGKPKGLEARMFNLTITICNLVALDFTQIFEAPFTSYFFHSYQDSLGHIIIRSRGVCYEPYCVIRT